MPRYRRPAPPKPASWVQEVGHRQTKLGLALYIRIQRYDEKPMGWEELWERFQINYPGRWALQTFPPRDCLVNETHMYHLFVLEDPPDGFRIDPRRPRDSKDGVA